jgi:hypothetical protein
LNLGPLGNLEILAENSSKNVFFSLFSTIKAKYFMYEEKTNIK